MFDMHVHSTYSDGELTPEEICKLAYDNKLTGLSITDHDTINGLEEFNYYAKRYRLRAIPGIEFGITYKGKECHILGYFIDDTNISILNLIKKAKFERNQRIDKSLNLLKNVGINISITDIKKYTNKENYSRSHIAKELVRTGYAATIQDAFHKFLIPGKIAYVPKEFSTVEHIISSIKQASGVAVLAHPKTIGNDAIVIDLIHAGIDGIEIVNQKHSQNDAIYYYKMVDYYKLIYTGGSDCHGKTELHRKNIGYYGMSDLQYKKLINYYEMRRKNVI